MWYPARYLPSSRRNTDLRVTPAFELPAPIPPPTNVQYQLTLTVYIHLHADFHSSAGNGAGSAPEQMRFASLPHERLNRRRGRRISGRGEH